MSKVTFRLVNLNETIAALRDLPVHLRGEAGHLVEGAGNRAVADIKEEYSYSSGNLRDKISVEMVDAGPFGVIARVTNSSPHAILYDEGSMARHTAIGANRGVMPAYHTFTRNMMKNRRDLEAQLAALLQRAGLRTRTT